MVVRVFQYILWTVLITCIGNLPSAIISHNLFSCNQIKCFYIVYEEQMYFYTCTYVEFSKYNYNTTQLLQQRFLNRNIKQAVHLITRQENYVNYSLSTTSAEGSRSPAARSSSNFAIRAGNLHTMYT
jgi:hypothetical protein